MFLSGVIQKLKLELHYLHKLSNPRYTPRERLGAGFYVDYIKNRFFGRYLAKRLPALIYAPDPDFEVHVLSQSGSVWNLIWSLRSFVHFSGLNPTLVVHSDGTLNRGEINILKEKFSGIRIITKDEADRLVAESSIISERVKYFRKNGTVLLMSLIDFILMARGKYIMVTGNDCIFYNKPVEIIDFVHGHGDHDALIATLGMGEKFDLGITENYAAKYGLYERGADRMVDWFVVKRSLLTMDKVNEFFENVKHEPRHYFISMACWSSLLAQLNFSFLPASKYKIKGSIDENTVMKHFTSPRRQELYAYGIDRARQLLNI